MGGESAVLGEKELAEGVRYLEPPQEGGVRGIPVLAGHVFTRLFPASPHLTDGKIEVQRG